MNRLLRFATVVLLAMAVVFAGTVVYFSDQPAAVGSHDTAVDASARHKLVDDQHKSGKVPSELVGGADVPVPEELPASLDGTNLPGGWAKTDSHGSLVPTPELRQLFEYYLAALGEETLPQLIARIEQALARLDEPARSEALAILGDYLDYKLALGDLEAAYDKSEALSPEEMQQRMAEIRALRRSWMDARTADAFFASDEAMDQFQVEQSRIRSDQSLSQEQRDQALAKAEQSLPAPLREARRETRKFADYHRARTKLADQPEALRAWREERFGEEASRQLEIAEARQQVWERKWQAYSEEFAKLDGLGVSGPEREAAIDSLRDEYFEGAEKLRAEALDSIR